MNYRDACERYRCDPVFRAFVDMMAKGLREMALTPGEMRDAAMLASIAFEEQRLPLPVFPKGGAT